MKKLIILLLFCGSVSSQSIFNENLQYSEKLSSYDEYSKYTDEHILAKNLELTSSSVPAGYYIGQYPSAANDNSAGIYFSIPANKQVRIVIMNILGQEIDVALNINLTAGTYKLNYDTSQLSAGIYVFRLESPDFTETRKLLLWN